MRGTIGVSAKTKKPPIRAVFLSLLCFYAHHLCRTARAIKAYLMLCFVVHGAVGYGIQGVIATHAHINTCKVLTASLANDNLAGRNRLIVVFLNA